MPSNCAIWGTTNVLWENGNWWWSQCSAIPISIPIPVYPPGVDATVIIQPWQAEEQWNPYRAGEFDNKKRIIQLICKVEGEVIKEEKEMREMKTMNVLVNDVKIILRNSSDIDLDIKLEGQNAI